MGKIFVLMGVCGCGKTTVGQALAKETNGIFIEGDSYHTPENVEKMRSGQPLTDEDRQGWLLRLAKVIHDHAKKSGYCFIGCSALKETYRETLRSGDPDARFIHLHGDEATLRARMAAREGHYMPASLLESQLAILETPEDAIRVDVDQPVEAIVRSILEQIVVDFSEIERR